MKIGLIQTRQNELYKFWDPLKLTISEIKAYQSEMIEQNIKLIKQACEEKCDLIVTTEAINYFGFEIVNQLEKFQLIPTIEDEVFNELSSIAATYSVYLVVGMNIKRNMNGMEKYYNSAIVYGKEGELITIHDKVHLVGTEKDYLTPGEKYTVFDTKFGRVGVCICWDMQFPETCRELVLNGADLVVCPTWGWEEKVYGHTRAYENGIYVAAAMAIPFGGKIEGIRTPSQVVSPLGQVLAYGDCEEIGVVSCEIDIRDCREHRELRMNDRQPHTYISLNRLKK